MGHVTWPRPFQERFVICRLGLAMFNPHTKFEVSTIAATKKWKATPNVKILFLSHPLGDLGVSHRVHMRLDGKRIVDLAIIKLFSLALTASALLGGSYWAQILGRCGRRPQSVYGLLEWMDVATTLLLEFYWQNSQIPFCATLWGLMGNVHGSSMAPWKVRGQLPIDANWTFLPAFTVKALWADIGQNCHVRKGGGSIWVQISRRRGYSTNDSWC